MNAALIALRDEPRAPDPPRRRRRDYALVIVVAALGIVAALSEGDVVWRGFAAPLAAALACSLLWRRSHPLVALAIPFTVQTAMDVLTYQVADGSTVVTPTLLAAMVLVYALFRWGSGREMLLGAAVVVASFVLSEVGNPETGLVADLFGATQMIPPAAVGFAVRTSAANRDRRIGDARAAERQSIARELHDTVAHHVSAIAVQAQAGQAVAATRPDAAIETLATIEATASDTLAEMRRMVSVLRDAEGDAQTAPQRTLRDVLDLAEAVDRPTVVVSLVGDLDDVSPSMAAGIYRLAQESLTNARRHARHASRIAITVERCDDSIRLAVSDDGDPVAPGAVSQGFGLVGMAERVQLLDGTFSAHPGPDRGWVVEAVLPVSRSSAPETAKG